MAASDELSRFLVSRRAKVSPEQAGLPSYGRRQVPGSTPARRRARPVKTQLRPAVLRMLDAIGEPATISTLRGDYLAANRLGRALYAPLFESREQPPNSARFTFLDPVAQEFFVDWERAARDLVATLRAQAGANPYDRALTDLVGELCTRSEPFRVWWAAHNIRRHQTGTKRLHHPQVGPLDLTYEVMELTADNGLRLAVFQAEPGSRSQQALDLLAASPPRRRPTTRRASAGSVARDRPATTRGGSAGTRGRAGRHDPGRVRQQQLRRAVRVP